MLDSTWKVSSESFWYLMYVHHLFIFYENLVFEIQQVSQVCGRTVIDRPLQPFTNFGIRQSSWKITFPNAFGPCCTQNLGVQKISQVWVFFYHDFWCVQFVTASPAYRCANIAIYMFCYHISVYLVRQNCIVGVSIEKGISWLFSHQNFHFF
jgi:hypothetical protein